MKKEWKIEKEAVERVFTVRIEIDDITGEYQFLWKTDKEENDSKFCKDGFFRAKKYCDGNIIFYGSEEFNGMEVHGIKVPDEVKKEIEDIISKQKRKKEKIEEEIKKRYNELTESEYLPKVFRYAVGGDTWHVYVAIDNDDLTEPKTSEDYAVIEAIKQKRDELEDKIEKILNSINLSELRPIEKRLDIHTGLYTETGWYEVDLKKFFESNVYKEYIEKERKMIEKKEKLKKELEEKRRKAIEEAKRTGKEVFIRRLGAIDGDDPSNSEELRELGLGGYSEYNEYGIVIINEVATPDGQIRRKGNPCY